MLLRRLSETAFGCRQHLLPHVVHECICAAAAFVGVFASPSQLATACGVGRSSRNDLLCVDHLPNILKSRPSLSTPAQHPQESPVAVNTCPTSSRVARRCPGSARVQGTRVASCPRSRWCTGATRARPSARCAGNPTLGWRTISAILNGAQRAARPRESYAVMAGARLPGVSVLLHRCRHPCSGTDTGSGTLMCCEVCKHSYNGGWIGPISVVGVCCDICNHTHH